MSPIVIAAIVSAFVAVLGLVAAGIRYGIRYGLVPHMRAELIEPLLVQLASVVQLANEAVAQVHVIAGAWDGHVDFEQREVDRLWEQMLIHERILNRQRLAELDDVPRQRPTERGKR